MSYFPHSVQRSEWSVGAEITAVSVHSKKRVEIECIEEEEDDHRPFEGRTLFIGDLAEDVSDQDIWELFGEAGVIDAVDVKKDRITGMNRGFGFVSFRTPHYAQNAINLFHGANLKGRTIRLGWAQKNAKVFIGIVPLEFNEDTLTQLMERFGPIQRSATRIENHFGFVEYLHRIHAERARSILDGGHLTFDLANGQQARWAVRLGWADEQTQKNCVHVQFDPQKAQHAGIGKYDLLMKFKPFGEIVSIVIPRHSNERMKGYGFVHYTDSAEGQISTANAILALDGAEIRGVKWTCNFGKQKRDRRLTMTQSTRKPRSNKIPIVLQEQRAAQREEDQLCTDLETLRVSPPRFHAVNNFSSPAHPPYYSQSNNHWHTNRTTSHQIDLHLSFNNGVPHVRHWNPSSWHPIESLPTLSPSPGLPWLDEFPFAISPSPSPPLLDLLPIRPTIALHEHLPLPYIPPASEPSQ